MENKLPFEKVERNILVKKDSETDGKFGKKVEDRSVKELIDYGVINVNKPQGPTSHQCSDFVQKILEIDKAGHGGSLDPNVTGVLPVALEKATRIVQTLLKAGKEYICLMHLHKDFEENEVRKIMGSFVGVIKQMPPVRSAVKRVLREREVYYIEIMEFDGQDILFKVGCQAGTYIRKLCDDIGKKLGTGAHMSQLVRTKAGPFDDKDWVSLHDLKDAYEFYKEGNEDEIRKIILPVERSVEHLPKIWVHDSCVDSLCHGADLSIPGISKLNEVKEGELIAIMTLKDELICIGNCLMDDKEILEKEKGKAVNTKKVFMERQIYPKNVSNN